MELTFEQRYEALRSKKDKGISVSELPNFIDECFSLLEANSSEEGKARVALILSGLVHKGLADRVSKFIEEHPHLPPQAKMYLETNYLRMNGH